MEVVAVPSLPKQAHLYNSADAVINSLLDFRPEKWDLPPFQDCKILNPLQHSIISFHLLKRPIFILLNCSLMTGVEGTLPIEPWHIGGPVIKGFGRGSKVLGIPTGM